MPREAGFAPILLCFGMQPRVTLKSMLASITDLKTLSITLIVSLILVLSNSMELAGQMQRMLKNFQGLISSTRLNLIIFPALIGLLPMPGGAVFSAPMVKELGIGSKLSELALALDVRRYPLFRLANIICRFFGPRLFQSRGAPIKVFERMPTLANLLKSPVAIKMSESTK